MKKAVLLLSFFLVLAGCAAKTTYIAIMGLQPVFENDRVRFYVQPGDHLEVLWKKGSPFDTVSWAVRDVKTSRVGFVPVKLMRAQHAVYTVRKGAPPLPADEVATRFGNGETTYITIVHGDRVWEDGQSKFTVLPDDQLEVLWEQTCDDGCDACWCVRDVETNRTGFVFASQMKARHRLHTGPRGVPPPTPDRRGRAAAPALASEPHTSEATHPASSIASPTLLHRVQPEYPKTPRGGRVQALVIVEAYVNEYGDVTNARILRGHPTLNCAAIKAVRQWRYKPLVVDGEPTPFLLTVTMDFNLAR